MLNQQLSFTPFTWRRYLLAAVYFLHILLLILFSGCATRPYVCHDAAITSGEPREIYIVNHDWHTGLVIPAQDIAAQLPQLQERFKTSLFLEFGWGDKTFYQADQITSGMAIGALFWPTESVMHVVDVSSSPELYFAGSEIITICLSARHYASLLCFIERSFQQSKSGQIVPLQTGIYGNSQFYIGTGSYSLLNTCNNWTAKALESAGLDIPFHTTLTAAGVMQYLSSTAADQADKGCHQEAIHEHDIPLQ